MPEEKSQGPGKKPQESQSPKNAASSEGGAAKKDAGGSGAEEKPARSSSAPDKGEAGKADAGAAGEKQTPGKPQPKEKSEQRAEAEKRSPKAKVGDEKGSLWMSRRNFFSRAGWIAFFSFCASFLIGSLRYMFPRVLFEPSPVFKAGFPDDYPVGSVSTKWVKEQRIWIVRDEVGIYAIFAQCTHLGCTRLSMDAENKFKSPCHGSGFTREGINFEGPAPRPLERVQIGLAEDGQILIDKSIKFLEENGEWGEEGSILPV